MEYRLTALIAPTLIEPGSKLTLSAQQAAGP